MNRSSKHILSVIKKNRRIIGLGFLFSFICAIAYLAAADKINVDGKLVIKGTDTAAGPPYSRYGLVLTPQAGAPTAALGRIYYDDVQNKIFYYDGTGWKPLGSGGIGDKYVASRIVAAANSVGTNCAACVCPAFPAPCPTSNNEGTCCSNSRADYVCNGIKDQEEINIALNEVSARGGGAVYLAEGTYNITTDMLPFLGESRIGVVMHDNTALIGTGKATVLKANQSSAIIINTGWPGSTKNCLITNLRIDGNKAGGYIGVYGINMYSSIGFIIDKIWIENVKGQVPIYLDESSDNIITNNDLRNNEFDSSANGLITITGAMGSFYNLISGNNIQDNIGTGIYLGPAAGNTVTYNNILNNSGTQGGKGIYLNQGTMFTYLGNVVSGNNIQNNSAEGVYLNYSGGTGFTDTGSIVSENNIQGNKYGIYLARAAGNVISANQINGNTLDGLFMGTSSETNTITGNMIYDNGAGGGSSGINLTSAGNNFISFNYLSDTAGSGYGINIDNASKENYLMGNYIYDSAGYSGRLINDLLLNGKNRYTDKLKINLERVVPASLSAPALIPIGSTLDVTTNPKAYIALNMEFSFTTYYLNATKAIKEGMAVGDMLILEGPESGYCVSVPSSTTTAVGLSGTGSRSLCQQDVLTLIWNGSKWIEVGWSDN